MRTLLFLLLLVCLQGCSTVSKMSSSGVDDTNKRIKALSAETVLKSSILDAEYDLFNVNGFSTQKLILLPGASGWHYKFAIKVDPSDLFKWIEGRDFLQTDECEMSWINEVVEPRKFNWTTKSDPKCYRDENSMVFISIYEAEGIIFKEVIQR